MVNKEHYLGKIKALEDIALKYSASSNILSKIDKCDSEINKFSLKILFVGGFSAGKSALINTILDRDLLVEDQKPETAIASEIIFDDVEYVELFDNQGNRTTCSLEEISSYDPDEYNHFTYHINSEYLKKYPNFTIVDMPGYNSGIERHNKAIMQYVAQGNAYILVVDCEEGELKSSVLDFIKEIRQYDNNLAIVISKSDKKPESHVESILHKVTITASSVFNRDITVISTSKYEDDVQSKINSILHSFDVQSLFEQKFEPQIVEIGNLTYAAIESVFKTSGFDNSEIEKEIIKRQKSKGKLVEQLSKERRKLSMKMKNQVKPSIINDIQNALQMNSASLAASMVSGGDSFSRTVNNILRPVLISSTQRYTEESFYEFIEQMDLSEIFAEDNSQKIADDISQKYLAASSRFNKIIANADKASGTYRTIIAALAITTSVVAPWIELILVFLPDILKMFGVLNQSSQMDNLKRKVENEIIPQIVSKMALDIDKSLQHLESEMIEEIENKINTLIEVETEALNVALNMKTSKQLEYDLLLKDIQSDLEEVQAIISNK